MRLNFFAIALCLVSISAHAQASGNKELSASANSSEKSATASETTSKASEGSTQGLLLPWLRVGPVVSLAVPRVYDAGIESRIADSFGFGFSYTPTFTLKVGDNQISTTQWNVRASWYPFSGSFFLGAQYGAQDVRAEAKKDVATVVAGNNVTASVTAKGKATSNFATPMIGWQWLGDSGIMFGTELGAQIPLNADTSIDATTGDATLDAAVKEQTEYKDLKKKADDGAKAFGNAVLPYWSIIKVGWLF